MRMDDGTEVDNVYHIDAKIDISSLEGPLGIEYKGTTGSKGDHSDVSDIATTEVMGSEKRKRSTTDSGGAAVEQCTNNDL
eukprot:CAMPEP_0170115248 /NCGR_PEP_ID=MMETSP0020_2-20130122/11338_1 /TAXON_ID=98059 /ORGANISM="Dinobryon sp., Strain UTEXLB2267" /LENGTH=79 /DNA_ID=CAMNT_0010342693 /DNA_START=1 /DNA_END=237 /DNA_ORIENTATION=+